MNAEYDESLFRNFVNSLEYNAADLKWTQIPWPTKALLTPRFSPEYILEDALFSPSRITDFTTEAKQFADAVEMLYQNGEIERVSGGRLSPNASRDIITFFISDDLHPGQGIRRPFLGTMRIQWVNGSYYSNKMEKLIGQVNKIRSVEQSRIPDFRY